MINDIRGMTFCSANKGSSQIQDSVERYCEILDGQGQIIRIHIEFFHYEVLLCIDVIIPWVVRHVSWLLTL